MEKINLTSYQNQIALLNEAIENARQQKQRVTIQYVEKMEEEGWVYLNSERWDYDECTRGISPRLIIAELAKEIGISKSDSWEEFHEAEKKYKEWLRKSHEHYKIAERTEIRLESLLESTYEP